MISDCTKCRHLCLYIWKCDDIACLWLPSSSIAAGGHMPTQPQPRRISEFTEIQSFLRLADSAPQQTGCISSMFITAWIMCSSAADCVCISGFWGLHPKTPTSTTGRRWGTSIPQTSCAHLTSKSWLCHCSPPLPRLDYLGENVPGA